MVLIWRDGSGVMDLTQTAYSHPQLPAIDNISDSVSAIPSVCGDLGDVYFEVRFDLLACQACRYSMENPSPKRKYEKLVTFITSHQIIISKLG